MVFFKNKNIRTICLFSFMICLNLLCANCDVNETGGSRSYNSEDDNVCPSDKKAPHYEAVDGQCLPSCGVAANLAGYGGYGSDGQKDTFDDPHIYSTDADFCEDLEALDHDDWEDFEFQDSSGSIQSNDQVKEVVRYGGVCCVQGSASTTTTTTTTTHPPVTRISDKPGECEVPNKFEVLKQMANDESDLLEQSNNCAPHYRNGGTYDFLEAVLVELRKTDTRWGYYHRTRHNLQHASSDAIAYYCGEGDGNGSSDLRFVDVITASCQVSWQDSLEGHAARAKPENGYWKYPRQ